MISRRYRHQAREYVENVLFQYHTGLMCAADAAQQMFVMVGVCADRVIELVGGEE